MVAEQIRGRGIRDPLVLEAMEQVPRHRFVPRHLVSRAHEDGPLPIGDGQTISQPFIVAEMTHLLRLTGAEKVLEVGTGSGYQTAVLARLAREVVTIERIARLSDRAREVLSCLGVQNVVFRVGDGSLGSPEDAPFDRILVTAAAPRVPPSLFVQLSEGGILVIPVGDRWEQDLLRVVKTGGRPDREFLGGCRFVPLVGEEGFSA